VDGQGSSLWAKQRDHSTGRKGRSLGTTTIQMMKILPGNDDLLKGIGL
jgi:hypothetical protein